MNTDLRAVLNSALEPTLDDRADYHAMMAAAGGALPSAAPGGGGSAICRWALKRACCPTWLYSGS